MAERSMEPIATALRLLMDSRGMSDTEVWVAAGISPGALSRYLHGSRGTTAIDWRGAATIEKLAAALGVEPSYFIEYRMWEIRQAAKLFPLLADEMYDLLMGYVGREPGGLSNLRSKGT